MKNRPDLASKPYYDCLICPDFRKVCGGIPTRGLDLPTWCEYVRVVMDKEGLTNADVAAEADTSVKTMERISSGKMTGIQRGTAGRIEVVVFGQVGVHHCRFKQDNSALLEQIKQLQDEVAYWRKENDRKAKIIDKYLD